LHEWRAGVGRRLHESRQQQERHKRFRDWLSRPG
jgi:hypothetical protein